MPNDDTMTLSPVTTPPAISEELSDEVDAFDPTEQLPSLDNYPIWFKNSVGSDLAIRENERLYTLNAGNARTSVTEHQFFAELNTYLKETCQSYKQKFHSELLMSSLDEIVLSVKTYASVVNK